PVATGAKLANNQLTVVAVGGDGDGYGIGAGYFLNSGRRNIDMTYIVFNNGVYGLTKGQASPTLAKGLKTKSMPDPSIQEGINPIAVALGAGYTWIGRGYALDVKSLVSLIVQAINHKGTSFLDVFQTCPVYNDLRTKEWYAGEDIGRTRIRRLEADPTWNPVVSDPLSIDEIVEKKTRALHASYETGDNVAGQGRIDLLIGCGDLPADYLDAMATLYTAPLAFIRGNHDPPRGQGGYPTGAEIDERVVTEKGLLVAGLEGSIRYSSGPHQYTERKMMLKVIRLRIRLRGRHPDILITHGPPAGVNEGTDPPHRGLKIGRASC